MIPLAYMSYWTKKRQGDKVVGRIKETMVERKEKIKNSLFSSLGILRAQLEKKLKDQVRNLMILSSENKMQVVLSTKNF